MRRFLHTVLIFVLVISLVSCNAFNIVKFEHEGNTYYYDYSDGIKTITNYHPYRFFNLPIYQEMIQYGEAAGLISEGVVYFVYAVDTSVDPESENAYYMAELDGETKELIWEEGQYFSEESDKISFVERLINLIDTVYFN